MNNRFNGMLGLAAKSGAAVSGEFSVEQALKKGLAYLVILAEDASENTKKHFNDMCSYRNVPLIVYSDKQGLGKYTGKQSRASVAILDKGFADRLISIIREGLI